MLNISIDKLTKDIEMKNKNIGISFVITINQKLFKETVINGVKHTNRTEAGKELINISQGLYNDEKIQVGEYLGFNLYVEKLKTLDGYYKKNLIIKGSGCYEFEMSESEIGNIQKIENKINSLDTTLDEEKRRKNRLEKEIAEYEKQLKVPFDKAEELKKLLFEQSEINQKLNISQSQLVDIVEPDEEAD